MVSEIPIGTVVKTLDVSSIDEPPMLTSSSAILVFTGVAYTCGGFSASGRVPMTIKKGTIGTVVGATPGCYEIEFPHIKKGQRFSLWKHVVREVSGLEQLAMAGEQ